MRHYEILANGCIPWFDKLDECPSDTMTRFPKQLVLEAMRSETPEQYIPQLLEYTRKHLTTRAMAQYIFDTVGCPTPRRVLFLSSDPSPDYLRCLTLIGMKEILGDKCVDLVRVPHIYEDYQTPTSLYGRGMSYTRILPTSANSPLVLLTELKEKAFDLIVYGSVHRGMPHWDIVSKHYTPSEIVFLCGEDIEDRNSNSPCVSFGNPYHMFVRELSKILIVQIGTNTGDDHVLKLCKRTHQSAVYLVEPFAIHNPSICKNYANIQNVFIENIAITPVPQEKVDLFYTEQDGPQDNHLKSYQVASIKPEHLVKHDYDPSKLKSISVQASTMNAFFEKHNLQKIDYLFLDIEGIDFEVLQSIDFDKVDIRMLQIEHLHLDKHKLFSFMSEHGYTPERGIDQHGFDTMFVKRGI